MFADACSLSRAARRRGRLPWLLVVGVVLALAPVTRSPAAITLATLFNFDSDNGKRGENPAGGLLRARDGNFYGTTTTDNEDEYGTIFRLGHGDVLTTLYRFQGSDGSDPSGTLIQGTDGNFYGTTRSGGPHECGSVFQLTPGGTLTTLHFFDDDDDGKGPVAGLVQGTDGAFYGTTGTGGTGSGGTVFKVTSGGVFTTLYTFTGPDGRNPYGALVQGTDGDFYGTTVTGGNVYDGTVFKMTPAGVLTTLHVFGGSDGRAPVAGLVQGSDGAFYGTTANGGNGSGDGTVFKVTAEGAFTTLHRFNISLNGTEGGSPAASLIQGTDGNFYGTTAGGPVPAGTGNNSPFYGVGTVFRLTPAGELTTLRTFNGLDASQPKAALVQGSDGTLYGTAFGRVDDDGYTLTGGSVFRLTVDDSPAVPVVTAVVTVRDAYWDAESIYGNSISGEVLLSLASAPTGTIKVAYTVGGDAQAGADYGILTGKVKFKRGETAKVITIDPVYTDGSGSDKLLKLKLAGGNGYTVKTTAALKVRLHLYP